jgi:hypothetical protein
MIIDCISSLPPPIEQFFNRLLLSAPAPLFRDSSQTIDLMLKEVNKLWKRLDCNPLRKARCEALKQEILELYERAKIKEKEREGQTYHKTQEFGYHVALPKTLDRDVYARLRIRRKGGAFKHEFRPNYAISKI